MENNIKRLTSEINTKKETVAWAWNNAKTMEEKKKLLEIILKNKGY